MPIAAKLDEFGKPAWIALMILGFIVWWPLGLAILAFVIGSGRMGCWRRHGMSRWQRMERTQGDADGMRSAGGGGCRSASSGNRAFDEYRTETLRRLEDEQREFHDFLDRCAWPRTSPSSTSSWPSGAIARIRTLQPHKLIPSLRAVRRRSPRNAAAGGLLCWRH